MKGYHGKQISDNSGNDSVRPIFKEYDFYLLILRWSVIFASALIYFTTVPDTGTLIPPFMVLIVLVSINFPITFYIYKNKPYSKKTIIWLLLLDILQGTFAVILTGGYSSLFFVLYLLSFFEAGICFNWEKAASWIVSIDALQVIATTLHWTVVRAPVSSYALVSRFIRLLIVGLIVILFGELLRREEQSQKKAMLFAVNLKKLNKIFTQLESAGLNKSKIFETLLRGIKYIGEVTYSFIIFRTNSSQGLWEIQATTDPELYPVGHVLSNLLNYQSNTFIIRKDSSDFDVNREFFKADIREVIGVNLSDFEDELKGLLIMGRKNGTILLEDEDFFLKALALETQLILHNTYLFEQKQKQLMKLNEFREIQTTFFSTAGHEIKTPLTILKTLHSTLKLTIKNPTINQEEILDTMESNISRLDNLTTDILETAKLESSDLILHKAEVNLPELIQHQIKSISLLAEKRKQKIILNITDSSGTIIVPTVYGDRKRISEILSNLLSNALKFSPPKSLITIEIRTKDKHLEICIFDKGPFISQIEQKRIFDKYYTSYSDKALTGFGLGLFIVKKLIDLHYGAIWVENQVQRKGFCFTLPIFKGNYHEEI